MIFAAGRGEIEALWQTGGNFKHTLPEPDLVVADRVFAGTAVSHGHEVVAFADLDAVALAVAAWRGMSIRVVPLDDRRPPATYGPVLELLEEVSAEASAGA